MRTILVRAFAGLLALAGIAALAVGIWLVGAVDSDGTATLSANPDDELVVLTPQVLNRVDHPVTIRATGDGELWAGLARPSDVESLLADSARTEVGGADIRDWALTTTDRAGDPDAATVRPDRAEIWQRTSSGDGTIEVVIDQEEAPQTLVLSAPDGSVSSLDLSATDGSWFTTALVLLIGGAVLLLAAIALLVWSLRAGRRAGRASAAAEAGDTGDVAGSDPGSGAGSDTDWDDDDGQSTTVLPIAAGSEPETAAIPRHAEAAETRELRPAGGRAATRDAASDLRPADGHWVPRDEVAAETAYGELAPDDLAPDGADAEIDTTKETPR